MIFDEVVGCRMTNLGNPVEIIAAEEYAKINELCAMSQSHPVKAKRIDIPARDLSLDLRAHDRDGSLVWAPYVVPRK